MNKRVASSGLIICFNDQLSSHSVSGSVSVSITATLSVTVTVCLSLRLILFLCLCPCLSVRQATNCHCLCLCPSFFLSLYLSVYHVCLSLCLSVSIPASGSLCFYVTVSVHLSLSVNLFKMCNVLSKHTKSWQLVPLSMSKPPDSAEKLDLSYASLSNCQSV